MTSNCFSEYTQSYQNRLMKLGNKKILQLSDLTLPPKILKLDYLYKKFINCYVPKKLSNNYNPKQFHFTFDVLKTIITFNKWYIIKITICYIY